MKNLRALLVLVSVVLTVQSTFAHKEHVHQYICREAYQLLKSQVGDIDALKDRIGNTETGQGPFNPGGLIVIGAHREDSDDVVWGYGWQGVNFGGARGTSSITHFWDADGGSAMCTNWCALSTDCYPDAHTKARKYIYGGWELQLHYPGTGITEAYEAPSFLPQFYKDHQIFYKGYYQINGVFIARNKWVTVSQAFVDRVVWEILGRVAHLLQDVSVPAHAHNDQHDPVCGGNDTFENYMDTAFPNWTRVTAINAGGFINANSFQDPIKYLFYTTNQIADHFPSNDGAGDNNPAPNDPFSNYPPLNNIISSLGPPPGNIDVNQIANVTFVYAIRATAGLYYWFAKHAGLLPPSVAISGPGYAPCATGTWTASITNGLPPFSYKWYHQWDCSGGGGGEVMMASSDPVPNLPCDPVWNPVGTNSSTLQFYLCCGNATLRVDVTDALNRTVSDQHYVVGNCGGGGGGEQAKMNGTSEQQLSNSEMIPTDFLVFQNYPNPFNPSTTLRYTLAEDAEVILTIYDVMGREISTLVNTRQPAGCHATQWDGKDASNSPAASGIYIYRLIAMPLSNKRPLVLSGKLLLTK